MFKLIALIVAAIVIMQKSRITKFARTGEADSDETGERHAEPAAPEKPEVRPRRTPQPKKRQLGTRQEPRPKNPTAATAFRPVVTQRIEQRMETPKSTIEQPESHPDEAFDLRRAIIETEILKAKFSEFE